MPKLLSALLLFSAAVAGEITLISPNEVKHLHDTAQRQFFALPLEKRRSDFKNPEIRQRWIKIGSRPVPVKLAWKSNLPANTALTLHLIDAGREFRFPVSGNQVSVVNLLPGRSYQWRISAVSPENRLVISDPGNFRIAEELPRLVDFGKLGNVRDLGGYPVPGGQKVRFDRIYRGRALNDVSPDRKTMPGKLRVTPDELKRIRSFRIKTDLELRSDGETSGMTDTPFGGNTRWVRTHGLDSYEKILKPELKPRFAATFRIFLNEANYPIYFHCDGGRDRTGMVAFLILGALGVEDAALENDWQTSALFFSDLKQESFDKFIAALKQQYGDGTYSELATRYLRDIGISEAEIAQLRSILLTD